MKTIAAISVALLTLASSSAPVAGQSVLQGVSDVQNSGIPTSLVFQASNSSAIVMSMDEVQAITEDAIRDAVSNELEQATHEALDSNLAASFEDLAKGKVVSFGAALNERAVRSISKRYSINIELLFKHGSLGGILVAKVELVPALCSLGAAIRPIASRESAEALDNLDPDSVDEIIARLSNQLASDFAAR